MIRRAIVKKITRAAERVLRLEPEEENQKEENVHNLPPTPEELLALEEAEQKEIYDARVKQKLIQLQHIIFSLPRGLKQRLTDNELCNRIRELTADIRVEDMPQKLLDALNDLDLL